MIFADSYFAIGKQHANEGKPCQDYATTQVSADRAIAVVSDGCSTGGKTDIGARIVASIACKEILSEREINKNSIQDLFFYSKDLLDLKTEDLYATLGVLNLSINQVSASLFGDGVVAYKNERGDITATKYEWNKGIPFYPVYNRSNFVSQVCNGDEESLCCLLETWVYQKKNNSWIEIEKYQAKAKIGIDGFKTFYRGYCSLDKYIIGGTEEIPYKETFIAIFSDGITQIKDVDWKDAVFEFMNYKSTSGEFVKRRMMKALKTMTPMDDISCSALRITPDADNEADTANA
jgi:hypothetical protein